MFVLITLGKGWGPFDSEHDAFDYATEVGYPPSVVEVIEIEKPLTRDQIATRLWNAMTDAEKERASNDWWR